ncbi:baseplate J/gp47 family protein [Xanthobacter sediminis]|uniref:baseplate J/gp47 family protein n=1 Tax=Xanthobacter sediminis TaxID=3119926 RepID=UPI00372C2928
MAIVCTVDATGIHAPDLNSIRSYLVEKFKAIYGGDVYLEADSQDGQWIDIIALALHDANAMAVSVYNAFSPSTAQGTGLSSVVKINGIARNVASRSTCDVLIGGTAGTTISNGQVRDANGVSWALPESVVIPASGQITATATCLVLGAISAAPGALGSIATPTRGWQTVTNLLAATEGAPIEPDAELRLRQSVSTALPSRSIGDGLLGAVLSLPGVERAKLYDNDLDTTDANGIPGHTIALVVDGGDAAEIAREILARKGPGCGTYGTTSETVFDAYAMPRTVRFFRPSDVPITVSITIKAIGGYTSAIGLKIVSQIAAYINGLDIGEDLYLGRLYVPANLSDASSASTETYNVLSILIARDGAPPTGSNIVMTYNEAAVSSSTLITLTVT